MEWKTVVVVCTVLVGSVILVVFAHGDAQTAVLGSFGSLLAGLLPAMFRSSPSGPSSTDEDPKIPPPPKPPANGSRTAIGKMWTFAAALLLFVGCGAAALRKDAAEETYLAQQLKCVDDNDTKWGIDSCRAAVKELWRNVDASADADGAR